MNQEIDSEESESSVENTDLAEKDRVTINEDGNIVQFVYGKPDENLREILSKIQNEGDIAKLVTVTTHTDSTIY